MNDRVRELSDALNDIREDCYRAMNWTTDKDPRSHLVELAHRCHERALMALNAEGMAEVERRLDDER